MIICLMGPTGCGKTNLAIRLCKEMPCDIVSVDSAMVYRGMDVGTAKPAPSLLKEFPHSLIDIRDPSEPYSAAQFCRDACGIIQSILKKGRIPLLVGGTLLYFHALQNGLTMLPTANESVRARLQEERLIYGLEALYERLKIVDTVTAQRVGSGDTQRIQRALEVYELTGQPISKLYADATRSSTYPLPEPVTNLILMPTDRQLLHKQLAQRLDDMFNRGLVDEVRRLYQRPDLNSSMPSLRAVGYQQVWQYLSGDLSESVLYDRILASTRQLAKRQITWLRRRPKGYRFEVPSHTLVEDIMAVLQ